MKQLIKEAIDLLEILHHEPAVSEALSLLRSAQSQPAADDKAGVEPVAWVRWDDDEKYWDVRRNTPSQEAVAYLAKWNRPPWLPAYPQPQAIPAGYALVPVEPTPEMLDAGQWMEQYGDSFAAVDLDEVYQVYRAMLAAAPKVK